MLFVCRTFSIIIWMCAPSNSTDLTSNSRCHANTSKAMRANHNKKLNATNSRVFKHRFLKKSRYLFATQFNFLTTFFFCSLLHFVFCSFGCVHGKLFCVCVCLVWKGKKVLNDECCLFVFCFVRYVCEYWCWFMRLLNQFHNMWNWLLRSVIEMVSSAFSVMRFHTIQSLTLSAVIIC